MSSPPLHRRPPSRATGNTARHRNIARVLGISIIAAALAFPPESQTSYARDAAFVTPGSTRTAAAPSSEGAVRVEPKGEIDIGESILNVARRTTLFFVNQSGTQVQIEKISVNSDGNVTAEITGDDCSKQTTLAPTVRCSVEVSVTPNTPGAWSVEVLMTHSGAGRIARAKLTGKTSGSTSSEKKDNGLSLSTKDIKPVDFGTIDVGQGKVVRSALMVNDSPDPITLYSIDVIEAENGLQRLDQGCAVDMELKSGESCPVTLVWTPSYAGLISTDLIIRHSGRLGFAVIPIRGSAKGETASSSSSEKGSGSSRNENKISSSIAPPLGAHDIEKALSSAISSGDLGGAATVSPKAISPVKSVTLHLIGTVGHRAVILKPDNTTVIIEMGKEFETGEGLATLMMVTSKSADISYDGKRLTLPLETAPELIANAPSLNNDSESEDKSDKKTASKKTRRTESELPRSGR